MRADTLLATHPTQRGEFRGLTIDQKNYFGEDVRRRAARVKLRVSGSSVNFTLLPTGQEPLSTKKFLLSMVCLGKRSVERGAGDFEEVGNALAVAVALVD